MTSRTIAVLAAAALAACQPSAPPQPAAAVATAADARAVEGVVRAWYDASARHDSAAWVAPLHPDFFIAAHAMVKKYTLVTRDAARFRTYFPALSIIAPDTHP